MEIKMPDIQVLAEKIKRSKEQQEKETADKLADLKRMVDDFRQIVTSSEASAIRKLLRDNDQCLYDDKRADPENAGGNHVEYVVYHDRWVIDLHYTEFVTSKRRQESIKASWDDLPRKVNKFLLKKFKESHDLDYARCAILLDRLIDSFRQSEFQNL